jgi:hypothetical protein
MVFFNPAVKTAEQAMADYRSHMDLWFGRPQAFLDVSIKVMHNTYSMCHGHKHNRALHRDSTLHQPIDGTLHSYTCT